VTLARALQVPMAFLVVGLSSVGAHADWAANGIVVAQGSSDQLLVSAAPSAGGVILVWQDRRSASDSDVYAQCLTSAGDVASGWPTTGLPVCGAGGDQTSAVVISDGLGGAYVAWQDFRGGSGWDIYAQHVTLAGQVTVGWPQDGLPVCVATGNQLRPVLALDESGGLLVAWVDGRSGEADYDIYSQRITPEGSIVSGWPGNGAVVCAAPGNQLYPAVVSDGANGIIAVWEDGRLGGTNTDLYAQRLTASGGLQSGWPEGGMPVCQASGGQFAPAVVADGFGGAIIAWTDFRAGRDDDVYACRITGEGVFPSGWPVGGTAVSAAQGNQRNPVIVADGSGGAILAWLDQRDGSANHLFMSRLTRDGVVGSGWMADGNPICTVSGGQFAPVLVGDGAGGSVVAWYDNRAGAGSTDIYAESLSGSGQPAPGWTAGGLVVCAAGAGQWFPAIVGDGAGGAFIAWHDGRSGPGNVIYAQHVTSPTPTGVGDSLGFAAGLDLPRPNPVTKTTQLSFSLLRRTPVTLRVFDASGRLVRILLQGTVNAGRHTLYWDGSSDRGEIAPSGVYFLQARWPGFEASRKIVKVAR
jgi:hypothetical protein